MTLPLPNLDDRTFADLVDEARTLIRTYQPEWTNYNPSDPGVTLVELFAWLAEMLIYRADQVPDRHRLAFLKLLNGPGWKPEYGVSIDDEIAATLTAVRRRYRAVTVDDYEALALEASSRVARALCLARRDLAAATEEERMRPMPGYVSVIVLPVAGTSPARAEQLRTVVRDHLEPRRLLTTQNVVAEPVWTPVQPLVLAAPRADVPAQDAAVSVAAALTRFLDPLQGGREGSGWPFGRDVYVSELYRVLEALPEVDYVPDIQLDSVCADNDPRCARAAQMWNAQGDQIGLRLTSHALPRVALDAAGVLVSDAFVQIRAVVSVQPKAGVAAADAARAAKAGLQAIFHPLRSSRVHAERWSTTSTFVKNSLVARLAKVASVYGVSLAGDPQHVSTNEHGEIVVALREHELADLQADVEVGV